MLNSVEQWKQHSAEILLPIKGFKTTEQESFAEIRKAQEVSAAKVRKNKPSRKIFDKKS